MNSAPRGTPLPGTILGVLLLLLTLTGSASAQQVKWESIAPGFRDAAFLRNDAMCNDCHDDVVHTFAGSKHAVAFEAGTTALEGGCESCHGPRGGHVDDPDNIISWSDISPSDQSNICMQCHAGGNRMSFKAGAHLAADLSCTSCHQAKAPLGSPATDDRANTVEACYGCHSEVQGQMGKPSHHPVREGRMDCASCHDVHGANASLLKSSTVSETCYGCHTEKRGPFLWEHAPVREDCANCHDAHGSTNRKLLNRKESFLCMSCHSYGGHINLPRYDRTSNPYGEGCVNCHITIHGSNHPSGIKFTR